MFRSVILASMVSLFVGSLAVAEPQTVSYFLSCPANVSCDIASGVPPQGFVLTDVLLGEDLNTSFSFEQVSGSSLPVAALRTTVQNSLYSFHSGIPFVGGSVIRINPQGGGGPYRMTLMGYIPGTSASSVPAVGGLGMTMLTLLILAAGGYILRRSSFRTNEVAE